MNNTIPNQSSIRYQYQIDPNGNAQDKNIQSNIVTIPLVTATLTMLKTVDKAYATIGDTLNYTIKLTNNGTILLSDINVKDILPVGVQFVAGSVKIDNTSQPTYDITTGINVGSMIILATKTITFQASVTSLPTPNTVTNKATSTFSYLVGNVVNGTSQSNTVTTTINVTNLSITKSANVTAVEANDEIIYTNIITNTGNIIATNIQFTDVLDSHLTFVTGSVTINGTSQASYNPNTGFTIPDIAPAGTVTITFKATVNQS